MRFLAVPACCAAMAHGQPGKVRVTILDGREDAGVFPAPKPCPSAYALSFYTAGHIAFKCSFHLAADEIQDLDALGSADQGTIILTAGTINHSERR